MLFSVAFADSCACASIFASTMAAVMVKKESQCGSNSELFNTGLGVELNYEALKIQEVHSWRLSNRA